MVTARASTWIAGSSPSTTASSTAAISICELAASETSSRRRYFSSAVNRWLGGLEVSMASMILPG